MFVLVNILKWHLSVTSKELKSRLKHQAKTTFWRGIRQPNRPLKRIKQIKSRPKKLRTFKHENLNSNGETFLVI
jgi:hypothetical protein